MKKFWMVYVEGGRAPSYKHPTLASAQAEAERLVKETGGMDAYVLEATQRIYRAFPPIASEELAP